MPLTDEDYAEWNQRSASGYYYQPHGAWTGVPGGPLVNAFPESSGTTYESSPSQSFGTQFNPDLSGATYEASEPFASQFNLSLSGATHESSQPFASEFNPGLSGTTHESSEHFASEFNLGSSGATHESSEPFVSEFIPDTSIFGPMDTKEVKEGTNQHIVAHTPAIQAIMDSSLLMDNIPSTCLTQFFSTT